MLKHERPLLREAADEAMRAGDPHAAANHLARLAAAGEATPDDFLRLAATRRALGDVVGALDAVGAALRLRPDHFLALLMGGSLLVRLGRGEEATQAYRAASRLAPPETGLPPALRRELAAGRAHVEAESAWRASLDATAVPGLAEASPDQRRRIARFRAMLAGRSDGAITYPDLAPRGFVDPARIDGIAALEAGFPDILREFLVLARAQSPTLFSFLQHAGPRAAETRERGSGRWSVIQLIADGVPVEANVRACPETIRLYRALAAPEVAGRSPNLMFSILDKHTRIPPHKGVTNTRLVLHLPLVVPPGCGIRVGTETRGWQPGRALVFDDTIDHEAWNDSDRPRVILLGDLWRPELSAVERGAIAALTGRSLSDPFPQAGQARA